MLNKNKEHFHSCKSSYELPEYDNTSILSARKTIVIIIMIFLCIGLVYLGYKLNKKYDLITKLTKYSKQHLVVDSL